jgi:hypothetical protein
MFTKGFFLLVGNFVCEVVFLECGICCLAVVFFEDEKYFVCEVVFMYVGFVVLSCVVPFLKETFGDRITDLWHF